MFLHPANIFEISPTAKVVLMCSKKAFWELLFKGQKRKFSEKKQQTSCISCMLCNVGMKLCHGSWKNLERYTLSTYSGIPSLVKDDTKKLQNMFIIDDPLWGAEMLRKQNHSVKKDAKRANFNWFRPSLTKLNKKTTTRQREKTRRIKEGTNHSRINKKYSRPYAVKTAKSCLA